jgi:DNA-binding Xre family transcriptional regulator
MAKQKQSIVLKEDQLDTKNNVSRETQLQQTAGKLKARRLFLQMEIHEAAKKADVSWPTLSNLEKGRLASVQTQKLENICNVYGWKLSDLFTI